MPVLSRSNRAAIIAERCTVYGREAYHGVFCLKSFFEDQDPWIDHPQVQYSSISSPRCIKSQKALVTLNRNPFPLLSGSPAICAQM